MRTATVRPSLVRVAKPSTATMVANQEAMAAAEQNGKVTTAEQNGKVTTMVVHQEAASTTLHPALAAVLQMLAKMTHTIITNQHHGNCIDSTAFSLRSSAASSSKRSAVMAAPTHQSM